MRVAAEFFGLNLEHIDVKIDSRRFLNPSLNFEIPNVSLSSRPECTLRDDQN